MRFDPTFLSAPTALVHAWRVSVTVLVRAGGVALLVRAWVFFAVALVRAQRDYRAYAGEPMAVNKRARNWRIVGLNR